MAEKHDANPTSGIGAAGAFVVVMFALGLYILGGQLGISPRGNRDDQPPRPRETQVATTPQSKSPPPEPRASERPRRLNFLESLRQSVGRTVSRLTSTAPLNDGQYADVDMSTEGVGEAYRQSYLKQGIRDEAYIRMQVLDQVDRDYYLGLASAVRAYEEGRLQEAEDLIRHELTAIRPEHVIGRMKLNTQLREVLMFVGRVGDADRVLQETTRLREGITRVTASALYDAGILAADEAESIRVAARESAAVEDGLGQAISVFTPEGSDGRTANERVGNMLGSVQVPTGDGP